VVTESRCNLLNISYTAVSDRWSVNKFTFQSLPVWCDPFDLRFSYVLYGVMWY